MYHYSGSHSTGSYSQRSHQDTDHCAVYGTGAIASTGVVGYYGPLVEGLHDCMTMERLSRWNGRFPWKTAANGHISSSECHPAQCSPRDLSALSLSYLKQPAQGLEELREPLYDLLEQNPYQGGVVAVAQLAPPLDFGVLRLGNALRDDMRSLPSRNDPAFPDFIRLSQKMSVRINVKGRLPFEHQATLLRRNNTGPTMGQLAIIIAREVTRFMDRERAIRNPLTHLDRELSIDDLVLVQVRHVSRGSIQPVLGVLRQ